MFTSCRPPSSTLAWAAALSFAEGVPLGLFVEVLPVYLALAGADPTTIGWVVSLRVAWSIKVLWSPWVARWGTWRLWVAGASGVMAAALAALAALARDVPAAEDVAGDNRHLWVGAALCAFALASATQDVAIDGAFARLVPRGAEGPANAWRIAAYRLAMLAAGGGMVALSRPVGWPLLCAAAALCLAAPAAWVWAVPSGADLGADKPTGLGAGVAAWLRAPGAFGVAAFIALYKFGDAAMSSMVKPFWVAHGRSPEEIGTLLIGLGLAATIAGGFFGGAYLARRPLTRALVVLGAWQAFSNLGYAAVALFDLGRWPLFFASVVESITQGLGAAALLSLVTRLADRAHATVHFALMTALAGVGASASAIVGGRAAASMGFGPFFAVSFLLCLPALLFLPHVRRRLAMPASSPQSRSG